MSWQAEPPGPSPDEKRAMQAARESLDREEAREAEPQPVRVVEGTDLEAVMDAAALGLKAGQGVQAATAPPTWGEMRRFGREAERLIKGCASAPAAGADGRPVLAGGWHLPSLGALRINRRD